MKPRDGFDSHTPNRVVFDVLQLFERLHFETDALTLLTAMRVASHALEHASDELNNWAYMDVLAEQERAKQNRQDENRAETRTYEPSTHT
jgi:hypothetical protein